MSFTYSFHLTALVRTRKTVWIDLSRKDIILFLSQRESIQSSSCEFFVDSSYQSSWGNFLVSRFSIFYRERVLDFKMHLISVTLHVDFICCDHVICPLFSWYVTEHSVFIFNVEPILHFWDKSHLVMAYNYFYLLLYLVLLFCWGFLWIFITDWCVVLLWFLVLVLW